MTRCAMHWRCLISENAFFVAFHILRHYDVRASNPVQGISGYQLNPPPLLQSLAVKPMILLLSTLQCYTRTFELHPSSPEFSNHPILSKYNLRSHPLALTSHVSILLLFIVASYRLRDILMPATHGGKCASSSDSQYPAASALWRICWPCRYLWDSL